MQLNNYLIIIPARKNSKRIIGKNLRELNGKPLISYSIEYALKQDINPKNIWVNTDDDRIINLAKAYNISSYKRPDILALDETSTNDVLIDFIDFTIKNNINYTHIITLQPTNPIRSEDLLIRSAEVLENSKRESLMSVSLLNKKFGKIKNQKYIPENYKIGQRHQDLEHLYYENGLIYISKKEALFIEREYITSDVYPYLTNDLGSDIDIDYETDLELAGIILKKMNL